MRGRYLQSSSLQNRRSTRRRRGELETLEDRHLLTFLAQIGSTESVYTPIDTARAVDGNGNTYVGGRFEGTADFDPGDGVYELTGDVPTAFVAKYDMNGQFLWARSFDVHGRSNGLYGAWAMTNGIAIDESGGVYVTGDFTKSIDLQGNSSFTPSAGAYDFFVAKLDSTTGETLWAQTLGGSDPDNARAIAVSNGQVYVTGEFHGIVDFDAGSQIHEMDGNSTGAYVLRLSDSGQFADAWSFGGVLRDSGEDIIVHDETVFVAGLFVDSADFDPSPATSIRTGQGRDWYLASYTTSGSLNWVQSFGDEEHNSFAMSISADDTKVYFASNFGMYGSTTLDADPSDAEFILGANGNSTAFIAAYSKVDGSLDSDFIPRTIGGASSLDEAIVNGGLTLDTTGAVYFGIEYWGTIDVDPGESTLSPPPGDANSVVLKLDTTGSYLGHWHTEAWSASPIRVIDDTLYVAGNFSGTADFPNGETLTSTGSSTDVYLLSLTLSEPPTADAGSDVVGAEDLPVTFDASGSTDPEGDLLTYSWDFGDGQSTETTSPTVDHVYTYGGTFVVTLTASDGNTNSAVDVVTAAIAEVNDQPFANPSGPYAGFVFSPVTLDASASSDFDNLDGTSTNDELLQFTWDFGDGAPSETTNSTTIEHTYSAAGTYIVTLTVADDTESSVAVSTTVTIEDSPVGDPKDIYVWDIADAFEIRQRGRNSTDHRIVLTVRNDSDGDGIAESTDDVIANVQVTVQLRDANGILVTTLTGTTDADGIFQSDWIRDLPPGEYRADVVDLALNTFEWNPLLDVEDDQLLTV